ncbi:lysozyme [Chelatococcus asaccharovorans]|uniref:Lysozyme n=1 Tax=Chelatococcus asaccharovorans TaxID=28210 RepID=A0A2V3UDT3_9HYPH|nr:lysozyme [Chelatococcus asaccharovorans]MBS7703340.1 lysozyme [Chelatococcus asaccharovorans]PXW61676.1 lysozyme [Chelatococcus asaccharovorans]
MSARARKALAAGAVLGLLAMTATYLTEPWEGTVNKAYWDRLGQVWTICTGETLNVKPGMVKTDAECKAMLLSRLENDFHKPLTRCIPGFDKAPLGWQGAMLDEAYNIGVGAACSSTAAKRARAGDFHGSCHAMTWFNRAGGKVIAGLKNRREYGDATRLGELELCLESLK